MTLCEVVGVSKSFGGVDALTDVTMRVHRGEVVAVIGPNGAGKTSLVNCITGFHQPDAGRVLIDGQNVRKLDPFRRALSGIARTFQTPQVFSSLSVRDHVQVAAHAHQANQRKRGSGPAAAKDAETVDAVLSLTGLSPVAGVQAGDLPLGLQRRVEIARSLALDPKVFLLDEPAAGLDRSETAELGEFLLDLLEYRAVGVLLVEHDMDFVGQVADHVYVFQFGRILAEGPFDDVLAQEDVQVAFLGEERGEGDLALA